MISTYEFDQIYKRNFDTAFNILKKLYIIKNKHGKIITISSVNALLDQSNEFAYSTAKNSILSILQKYFIEIYLNLIFK